MTSITTGHRTPQSPRDSMDMPMDQSVSPPPVAAASPARKLPPPRNQWPRPLGTSGSQDFCRWIAALPPGVLVTKQEKYGKIGRLTTPETRKGPTFPPTSTSFRKLDGGWFLSNSSKCTASTPLAAAIRKSSMAFLYLCAACLRHRATSCPSSLGS